MKTGRFSTAVSVGLVISAGLIGYGSAKQPKEKTETERKPPEAKALGKLVGTWGPATNNFKAMKAKWVLGKTYVQIDKHFNDEGKVDTMTLLAWDKQKKAYRCWQFSRLDDGSPEHGEGTWDDKSNTLTFTCAPNTESRRLMIAYIVSGDSLTYKEGIKDKGGKVDWGRLTCEWNKRKE
ncbi:MAG TPA: hypothetical protein VG013_40920 [Gemmataceae bacterium]|jgi:hypothetical protein|nr:hypothetical protein [Gemmataceae bacterium]